jgi:hypothetical protein
VPLQSQPDSHQYSMSASIGQDDREEKRSKNVQQSRSKNVSPRRRRKPSKDAKSIEKICTFGNSPQSSPVGSLVATSTPIKHPKTHTPSITSSPSAIKRNHLPQWEHTSDEAKAFAAVLDLSFAGKAAHAFNFNLTPEAIDKAMSQPKRFLESLKRLLDRELARAGIHLPNYLFSVDMDYDKRLHLHGAFDAAPELLPAIGAAMKKAWGEQEGPGKKYQLKFKPLYSEGWAYYLTRNRRRVTKIIGATVAITHPLRRDARSTYNRLRTIIGDASELIDSGLAKDDLEALELLDMGMGLSPLNLH